MNTIRVSIEFKGDPDSSVGVNFPVMPRIGEKISLTIDGELHKGQIVDLVHEMELNSGSDEKAGFQYRYVKIIVDPSN